jgi:hypothetical protein
MTPARHRSLILGIFAIALALGVAYLRPPAAAQESAGQIPGTDPSERFFPFLLEDETRFTGYALTNYSDEPTRIVLTAYGEDGSPLPLPRNPSAVELPPKGQVARLGREIFSMKPGDEARGWVHVRSEHEYIGGFFQHGEFSLERLDGGPRPEERSRLR